MARIKIDFDDADLRKNLKTFGSKLNRNVAITMDYNSGYAMRWLKSNAPWRDDTGAARSGLIALPFSSGNQHELLMAYSVTYGIWLEIANSGQYAVITPAMRIVGSKIMDDMQNLINRMT
jgi:hypothetical protein